MSRYVFLTFIFLLSGIKGNLDEGLRYIVLFRKPEVTGSKEAMIYMMDMKRSMKIFEKGDQVLSKFRNGYVGQLCNSTVEKIKLDPAVAVVEKDQEISILQSFKMGDFPGPLLKIGSSSEVITQENAPWGISRISNGFFSAKRSEFRYPESAGRGIKIFVVDTGIDINHDEFSGRATWGINLVENTPNIDENGHGTHCAGIIAGSNVGIAKKAELVAVKVLDKNGGGLVSKMILALDFVIKSHSKEQEKKEQQIRQGILRRMHRKGFGRWKRKFVQDFEGFEEETDPDEVEDAVEAMEKDLADFRRRKSDLVKGLDNYFNTKTPEPKTIVNMSVGGVRSKALNFVVEYASSIGIHFSAAAGNDHEDACEYSPGSSKVAFTVGASTKNDRAAVFSNYGRCVDIYAPGFEIVSSWVRNTYKVASGTSMAAPHVAGVMALYLGEENYGPKELNKKIIDDALRVIDSEDEDLVMVGVDPFNFFVQSSVKKLPLVTIERLLAKITRKAVAY